MSTTESAPFITCSPSHYWKAARAWRFAIPSTAIKMSTPWTAVNVVRSSSVPWDTDTVECVICMETTRWRWCSSIRRDEPMRTLPVHTIYKAYLDTRRHRGSYIARHTPRRVHRRRRRRRLAAIVPRLIIKFRYPSPNPHDDSIKTNACIYAGVCNLFQTTRNASDHALTATSITQRVDVVINALRDIARRQPRSWTRSMYEEDISAWCISWTPWAGVSLRAAWCCTTLLGSARPCVWFTGSALSALCQHCSPGCAIIQIVRCWQQNISDRCCSDLERFAGGLNNVTNVTHFS